MVLWTDKPSFGHGPGSKHANAQFSKYFKDLKNNEAYQNVSSDIIQVRTQCTLVGPSVKSVDFNFRSKTMGVHF